ncbi:major histocompatibility complex class I-related gene protein-like isoform X3 [Anolis sagrei]|uniref:major histocompatibility complex class I-related gene protein-like isoform X3 n=1 Tax=Anolis sagrei TaxID=38937 RepID=UPI003521DEF7
MALLLLLRVVALLLFLGDQGIALPRPAPTVSSRSSFHSLRYFYTAASEDNEWLPSFTIVGYMDDKRICQYDSTVQVKRPCVSWMKKVVKDDPHYWKDETEVSQNAELFFKESLVTAKNRYNQSGGYHTLQQMYGCELRRDGSKGGYRQYAYDGKDFISFDKETLTWTAADVEALITKRRWDAQSSRNYYLKDYLEKECIEWLQKYLEYGKETLLRTEKPEVMVTRKEEHDGMETLICRVGGFYPKEIDIDWTRDGEVWQQDVFHGLVSPNSDGTYYTWRSITVDPKERKHYKCHVEHDALQNPVDVAWKEPPLASKLGLIVGCVVVVLLLPIAVIAVYFKKRQRRKMSEKHQDDYKTVSEKRQRRKTSGSDKKSNISKEESDEGFSSSREASEKGAHYSEERVSLCTSGGSGSSVTASEKGAHYSEERVSLCPSGSSGSIEIVHEKDTHNSEERTSLCPSGSSGSTETV